MKTQCPYCHTFYEVEEADTGHKAECVQCGRKFVIYAYDTPIEEDPDRTQVGRRSYGDLDNDNEPTMRNARARREAGEYRIGDHIIRGRYEIRAILGRGGMGIVYRCYDTVTRLDVALKTLPPELSGSAEEMEDIRANFAVAGRLIHPNIAAMRTLEEADNRYFLVMDFVDGVSLKSWVRKHREEGPWNLPEFLGLIRQVAAALDYAHSEGVIHRDVKPANIMITAAGQAKLLDFGLAAQVRTSMTHISMAQLDTSGTSPYMAPEQWKGRGQRAATDQYALAVTVYEMLAGQPPFENPDKDILRTCVLTELPEELDNVPAAINAALQKALAKDPRERFADCSAFTAALDGAKPLPPQSAVGDPASARSAQPATTESALRDTIQNAFRESIPTSHTELWVIAGSYLLLFILGGCIVTMAS